jgi:3-oxoadipate enol-lactonase
MARVETATADVEYFVDGNGAPLVLVHGTGGNAQTNWGHLVDRFAAERRVVRPNYSGSGGTRDKGGVLSVERIGAEVIAAADAADAAQFDLLGFSLGAAVTTWIAAHHPGRVRRLVLLAGFADSGDTRLQCQFELWNRLIDTDRRAAAQLILLTGFSPSFLSTLSCEQIETAIDEMVAGNNWDGMSRQVDVDLSLDVRAEARAIQSPTLVLACQHDHMVAPVHSRALHEAIKPSIYRELVSGHLAPLEAPDRFVEEVCRFLA